MYSKDSVVTQAHLKGMDGLKRLSHLIKVAFVLVFIFHFSNVLYNIMYPTTPGIRVYKTTLDKITFPISLLICANQIQNNSARYEQVGYPDYLYFYYGISKYNNSLFGWHGHSENGSSLGSVEGRVIQDLIFIL